MVPKVQGKVSFQKRKKTEEIWKETRLEVLKRDKYRCLSCGIGVTSAQADIHHVLPRSRGGSDELSNLITLCDGCHAAQHPNQAAVLARGLFYKWTYRLAKLVDFNRDLPASGDFLPALRIFGNTKLRDGQLPVIMAALKGHSVFLVSPTGSGKTLCFQLPAIMQNQYSIVISPLKTLMREQVASLLKVKIPSLFINSDLRAEDKAFHYAEIRKNMVKMVYLTPERFFTENEKERADILQMRPAYFIIDEAHCVDQWGKDFRPRYGKLKEVRKNLGNPPVLAFTATAGVRMQKRIIHSLGIKDAKVFVRGVDRPNIALMRMEVMRHERTQKIAELLTLPEMRNKKCMIFVPTRKIGNELRQELKKAELELPFYHSTMGTPFERQELVKRFMGQSQPVVNQIICTNAFGMGLDVPDVRMVIHWQQAATVEDQLQEYGRAGRDGKQAVSVIFYEKNAGGKDISLLKFMAEKTVSAAGLNKKDREQRLNYKYQTIADMEAMLKYEGCFRGEIIKYFDESSSTSPRFSLALWILNKLFVAKKHKQKFQACCDYCAGSKKSDHFDYLAYIRAVLKEKVVHNN